jgi:hypothetical protein
MFIGVRLQLNASFLLTISFLMLFSLGCFELAFCSEAQAMFFDEVGLLEK